MHTLSNDEVKRLIHQIRDEADAAIQAREKGTEWATSRGTKSLLWSSERCVA